MDGKIRNNSNSANEELNNIDTTVNCFWYETWHTKLSNYKNKVLYKNLFMWLFFSSFFFSLFIILFFSLICFSCLFWTISLTIYSITVSTIRARNAANWLPKCISLFFSEIFFKNIKSIKKRQIKQREL